jgi:hypothetical protein
MFTTILGLFTSGGFGAITGLIGGWLAKREQRKLLELNNDHDFRMANVDLKRDQLQFDHALAVVDKHIEKSQAEGEIATDVREADAFVESIQSEAKSTGTRVGDAIRSAIRPLLTGFLLFISWTIYSNLDTLVGGLQSLDKEVIEQLFVYVVHSILFLTITAVSWWFASRGEKSVAAIKSMMK